MPRWSISVSDEEKEKSEPLLRENDKIPFNIINNYFSIGVDAAICSKFHMEREKNPNKFNNRMKNKLWYFEYATSEQVMMMMIMIYNDENDNDNDHV